MLKSLRKLSSQNAKRPGRGISAGQGKTAGRGTKGQKSRSGHNIPRKFEGGQMPFSMRMPKVKGFKSLRQEAVVISLDTISANFKNGDKITLERLIEKQLAKKGDKVKVLNNGKLTITVTFEVPCSKSIQVSGKEVKNAEAKKPEKADKEFEATKSEKKAPKTESEINRKKPATKVAVNLASKSAPKTKK